MVFQRVRRLKTFQIATERQVQGENHVMPFRNRQTRPTNYLKTRMAMHSEDQVTLKMTSSLLNWIKEILGLVLDLLMVW